MQVDEKALEAARQAYQASIPDGAWHADGGKTDTPMRAAIAAYLSALGEQKPVASVDQPELFTIAYMQGAYNAVKGGKKFRFPLKSRVTKTKGSSWTGRVVGFYSTTLTPIGYAVPGPEQAKKLGIHKRRELPYIVGASDTVNLQAVADADKRSRSSIDGRALCRGIGVPTSRKRAARLPVMLFRSV